MNKRGRAKEVTWRSGKVMVFKRSSKTSFVLCEACACGMLTLEEAVVVAGVSSRLIYQRVEDGLLHFIETPEGLLLICLHSMLRQFPKAH
jgi:hypothetical protein